MLPFKASMKFVFFSPKNNFGVWMSTSEPLILTFDEVIRKLLPVNVIPACPGLPICALGFPPLYSNWTPLSPKSSSLKL